MTFYPFYNDLQTASKNIQKGNFGLWYNKFIPLNNENQCKPSNAQGSDTEPVEYYYSQYGSLKNNAAEILKKKHADIDAYSKMFPNGDYEKIFVQAKLITPLITGIGESHPHEVSMVFDHNMGIPYIPASGVKGIVRFAHTLSIFLDETGAVKDEYKDQDSIDESATDIIEIFGGQRKEGKKKEAYRGKVVFLDAYPEKVPELHIDIMNPHYGAYYGDLQKKTPPADYLSPNPIKFLTVAQGTIFIFRAIAEKRDDIPQKVREALRRVLTEEGVGAKTAVGYGRFEIMNDDQTVLDQRGAVSTKTTVQPPPVEEVWENASVSFNAGSGGIVTAQSPDKKMASIRGKEKAVAITDASLHKKLFEGKKTLPKARVTVRKTGNAREIVKVEPAE